MKCSSIWKTYIIEKPCTTWELRNQKTENSHYKTDLEIFNKNFFLQNWQKFYMLYLCPFSKYSLKKRIKYLHKNQISNFVFTETKNHFKKMGKRQKQTPAENFWHRQSTSFQHFYDCTQPDVARVQYKIIYYFSIGNKINWRLHEHSFILEGCRK